MSLQLLFYAGQVDALVAGLYVGLGIREPLRDDPPGGAVSQALLLHCVQVFTFGLQLVL